MFAGTTGSGVYGCVRMCIYQGASMGRSMSGYRLVEYVRETTQASMALVSRSLLSRPILDFGCLRALQMTCLDDK